VASKGAKLLRGKREVLADRFFRLMRDVVAGRVRLDESLLEATRALILARSYDGNEALESVALAAGREVPVEVKQHNVWGVPTPEVSAPRLVREADARGSSPVGWSLTGLDAARRYEESLEVLLGISSREFHLRRLGEEIQATSRRINAIEQLVMPRLDAEAARIELSLEERSREDAVRLKRFRGRPRS
jgi:V/A-type H+/Na+-transporting ATPase subunit D